MSGGGISPGAVAAVTFTYHGAAAQGASGPADTAAAAAAEEGNPYDDDGSYEDDGPYEDDDPYEDDYDAYENDDPHEESEEALNNDHHDDMDVPIVPDPRVTLQLSRRLYINLVCRAAVQLAAGPPPVAGGAAAGQPAEAPAAPVPGAVTGAHEHTAALLSEATVAEMWDALDGASRADFTAGTQFIVNGLWQLQNRLGRPLTDDDVLEELTTVQVEVDTQAPAAGGGGAGAGEAPQTVSLLTRLTTRRP